MSQQATIALTMLLKPLGLLAFFGIAYAGKRVAMRVIPEGRVKRLLLRRIN